MDKGSGENKLYRFGPFLLDVRRRVLLRDNQVVQLQPKAVDTLIALVEQHGQIISKDELINAVWPDTIVEEGNLTLNISAVRKALGDNSAAPSFIETFPKRGYRFLANVEEQVSDEDEQAPAVSTVPVSKALKENRWGLMIVIVIMIIVAIMAITYWQTGKKLTLARSEIKSPADEAEVRRVVKESQIYETLTLYTNPDAVENVRFDYWLPKELGGTEIDKVRTSLEHLRQKNLRYGPESRLERFDFTYVRILSPGDYAEVGTIERWYVPLYNNGQLVTNRNVYLGPYTIDYTLRKIKGVWLIEKTTTPRANQDN